MAHSLSSDEFKAIAQSVLWRCEYLSAMFDSDAPATARTGLVSLNRTIYLLTTRYLRDPVEPYVLNPDVRAHRALGWYQQYLTALVNASQFVQRALDEGLLTPCCLLSGAPFPHDALSDWTQRDIAHEVSAAARTFWETPPTSGTDSEAWPDYVARAPGVGVEQRELDGLFATMMGRSTVEPSVPANASSAPPSADALIPERAEICAASGGARVAAADQSAVTKITTHRVGKDRTDILDPVIAVAERMATEPGNWQSVWPVLIKLAESDDEHRPDPLLGYIEGEGIKYRTQQGKVEFFTARMLQDRFRRRARKRRRLAALSGA